MKRMHDYDHDGAELAAGVKTGFAVLFVGLLVALGLGVAPLGPHDAMEATPTAAAPAAAGTPYFPSQFPLDAAEPAEHVEAF